MWEELLEEIQHNLRPQLHELCEQLDDRYIALEEGPAKRDLGMVITHLKDARSALERAEDAVP
jgi:hypothetical protein